MNIFLEKMSSASLMDYLSEKLYSLSSKVRDDYFQPTSNSFLMNGNRNFQQYDLSTLMSRNQDFQQYDLSTMSTEVKERNNYHIKNYLTYQSLPLIRFAAGMFGSFGQLKSMDNHNYLMDSHTERAFSPLFNFLSDSYLKFKSSLISPDSQFLNSTSESALGESHMINQQVVTMGKQTICSPQITKMSVDINNFTSSDKSEVAKERSGLSQTVRLNLELSHRKMKEMTKRSKRRRRRKKKSEQLNVNSSTPPPASDDEASNNYSFSVTDSSCLSENPDFECAMSLTHAVQLSPQDSFFISSTNDSDDDSEWETFDEIKLSTANNESSSEIDSNSSLTPDSSPTKCKRLKPKELVDCSFKVSSVISFIVPESNSSDDDDSDWDTCELSTFSDETDFELSGLYFTNLCMPQSHYRNECFSDSTSEEECEEILELKVVLLEANKKWNELQGSQERKSTARVTFAPDEDLVEIFPVDIFERKGEWEIYATERIRFKRKIDELEKIISPCLNPEHRSNIFKKIVEPKL